MRSKNGRLTGVYSAIAVKKLAIERASLGQVRGSGVSVLSESRDSVIGGVRVRLGVDVGSLGCFFGGLRVAVIEGVGGYEVSGLFQARQRHVALLLDPIIMLLG